MAAALPTASQGQTLPEALALAYRNNPTLTGARADQRANDEQVAIELAAGRPNLSISGSVEDRFQRENPLVPGNALSVSGIASLPVYSGGTVRNAIRGARLQAEGGAKTLEATQAAIFARVVASYTDVIRDTEIVAFSRQNVASLRANLDASTRRFEVGDLTRTDVAQSETRLSVARADLALAEAQLIGSKEAFIALVGVPPQDLAQPMTLPGLPVDVDTAVEIAVTTNPDVLGAQKYREATSYAVRAAKGRIAPRISVFASGQYLNNLGSENSNPLFGIAPHTLDASAGVNFTVPIYQGGLPGALARQQADRESAAIEREVEIERAVIEQARSAFADWRNANVAIVNNEAAVGTAVLALESVRTENSAGTRTILDILNAEQEVLNAKIRLAQARRNAYVAAFSLIASMGRAQPRDLGLPVTLLYDAERSQSTARHQLLDASFGPKPERQATPTNGTPAQTAEIPG